MFDKEDMEDPQHFMMTIIMAAIQNDNIRRDLLYIYEMLEQKGELDGLLGQMESALDELFDDDNLLRLLLNGAIEHDMDTSEEEVKDLISSLKKCIIGATWATRLSHGIGVFEGPTRILTSLARMQAEMNSKSKFQNDNAWFWTF